MLTLRRAARPASLPRLYKCQCGTAVFFRNNLCLRCETPLGYEPIRGRVSPLAPGTEPGTWTIIGDRESSVFRYCANAQSPAVCNWLVPVDAKSQSLCISCRLNRTIPDLTIAENGVNWQRIELAKRRLVSELLALQLPVKSRVSEDPEHGLAFDFLRDPPDGPRIVTGHSHGVITLNIEEADDAIRERTRAQMHEPYRTVLGHLRHEVGHYYWERLVDGSQWLDPFRQLFGDDRAHYADALARYYREGPAPDWQMRHVSAYASSHPWEDWAETWAHYLHIVDTLETAFSFRLNINSVEMPFEPFQSDALVRRDQPFLNLVNSWARFTAVLNEFSRSMGLPDFYPFVLSKESVKKVHFIHTLIASTHT